MFPALRRESLHTATHEAESEETKPSEHRGGADGHNQKLVLCRRVGQTKEIASHRPEAALSERSKHLSRRGVTATGLIRLERATVERQLADGARCGERTDVLVGDLVDRQLKRALVGRGVA